LPTGFEPVRRQPTPSVGRRDGFRTALGSHLNALTSHGGVSRQIVSGNPKGGITKARFYGPTVNRTYVDMAAHYRPAIIPARPYKLLDQAKVEISVQVVQRRLLARLRNRRFFSLGELKRVISELTRPTEPSVNALPGHHAPQLDQTT
jgi:transposase